MMNNSISAEKFFLLILAGNKHAIITARFFQIFGRVLQKKGYSGDILTK